MNNEQVIKWVELIESSCTDLKIKHIDMIIDQAGSDFSLLPTLTNFETAIQWGSLFKDLPEEILLEDAPLLIRIDLDNTQQRQWMIELDMQLAGTGQLLMLCSIWPFASLADYLTRCTNVVCGSQEGIFRFYDSRIFPLLFSHILNAKQQAHLLRPAIFWSWLDRDNQPRQIAGNGALLKREEEISMLILDDRQLENLMCVCDVNLLLRHLTVPDTLTMGQETVFSVCYEGMMAATEAGLLMDDERDDFVKQRLLGTVT